MRSLNSGFPTTNAADIIHLPAIARIMWAFTRHTVWRPNVRSRYADLMTLAKVIRRGWVQLLSDTNGTQAFIVRDGPVIHALYVFPEQRGLGHGKRLINEAKKHESRLELWTEQMNQAAIGFYEALGFLEVARSNGCGNDENLPDIHFVWHSDSSKNHREHEMYEVLR